MLREHLPVDGAQNQDTNPKNPDPETSLKVLG